MPSRFPHSFPTVALLFSAVSAFAIPTEPASPLTLWYREPADARIKALPIGNGRFGAMVFGQPEKERLQLNDVTVWSGNPQPYADRKDAYKDLPELRRLIRESQDRYVDPKSQNEDRYYIDLLPALPADWATGEIRGLRARGGFTIDLAWKAGQLSAATVRSVKGSTGKFRYAGRVLDLKLAPGQSASVDATLAKARPIQLSTETAVE